MVKAQAKVEYPEWVSPETKHYLQHTVGGTPIRSLARRAGVHASTILRQIRRIEQRRDDALLESALQRLTTDADSLRRIADLDLIQAMRKLCEPGALMAVGAGIDRPVIVRDGGQDGAIDATPIGRDLAEMLVLREWISSYSAAGRVVRYALTQQGRQGLQDLVAAGENRARALAEDAATFTPKGAGGRSPKAVGRVLSVESPVQLLARRKEKDGRPFLDPQMVRVAERLREDFELACYGEIVLDDMESVRKCLSRKAESAQVREAKQRVLAVFDALGPGLSDVCLRCCCLLEGMEHVERVMGWSARSGKIVLRIALQRLILHYHGDVGDNPMIG